DFGTGYSCPAVFDPSRANTLIRSHADISHVDLGFYWANPPIQNDGNVVCWGDNTYGQLTVPPGLSAVQVSTGLVDTCVVQGNGSVVCLGHNSAGQLNVPSLNATEVSAGWLLTPCAVQTDGSVVCWGDPSHGQTSVPSGLVATQVSSGYFHVCAVQQ